MDREEAAQLLRWYAEIGVDEAVCDETIDRFAVSSRPVEKAAPARPRTRQAVPAAPRAALEHARALANDASSLGELLKAIEDFDGCPLKRTATTTCISDGNPDAGIMIIGEAPTTDY